MAVAVNGTVVVVANETVTVAVVTVVAAGVVVKRQEHALLSRLAGNVEKVAGAAVRSLRAWIYEVSIVVAVVVATTELVVSVDVVLDSTLAC